VLKSHQYITIVSMDKKDFIEWAEKLQKSYQPSELTSQTLAQIDLVAIVGPTGVGKSTIIDKLGIPYVVSDVSRDSRPDEKNEKNYNFRTDYLDIIQQIKNGEYVQFLVSKYGEFYGTRLSAYPESGPCTMAVVASEMPNFRKLGFRSVTSVYVMPPSYIEWMRRIGGVRSVDLLGRIDEARQSILMALDDESYHFVLNDVLDLAIKDVHGIIAGNEVNQHRSQLAYDTADVLLERIGDEA
jgi:guanylate kinase